MPSLHEPYLAMIAVDYLKYYQKNHKILDVNILKLALIRIADGPLPSMRSNDSREKPRQLANIVMPSAMNKISS